MENKKGIICFDMDGTIADFYNVPNWQSMLDNEDPTPYVVAKPLWDMKKLREILIALSNKGWEIRIITWLSKKSSPEFKNKVRDAKTRWLEKYDFPMNKAHMIQYGTTKANCVRKTKLPAILIDDNQKICNRWSLGDTIDPATENIIEVLEKLLED